MEEYLKDEIATSLATGFETIIDQVQVWHPSIDLSAIDPSDLIKNAREKMFLKNTQGKRVSLYVYIN